MSLEQWFLSRGTTTQKVSATPTSWTDGNHHPGGLDSLVMVPAGRGVTGPSVSPTGAPAPCILPGTMAVQQVVPLGQDTELGCLPQPGTSRCQSRLSWPKAAILCAFQSASKGQGWGARSEPAAPLPRKSPTGPLSILCSKRRRQCPSF